MESELWNISNTVEKKMVEMIINNQAIDERRKERANERFADQTDRPIAHIHSRTQVHFYIQMRTCACVRRICVIVYAHKTHTEIITNFKNCRRCVYRVVVAVVVVAIVVASSSHNDRYKLV